MKTTSCSFLLTAALAAQQVPLPEERDRVVQVFDVEKLVPSPARAGELALRPIGKTEQRLDPLLALVDTLTRFVDPPLGADDDLKPLGTRRLVLLGSRAQCASLEALLKSAKDRSTQLIDVRVQLFTVADKAFQEQLGSRVPPVERGGRVTREAIVDEKAGDEVQALVEKHADESVDAPTLTVQPLRPATMSTKRQVAYVKDFTITRKGDRVVADPVLDVAQDGLQADVCATFLPDGSLGVACSVTIEELEKPIATFQTNLGAGQLPVTIQLPEITATRLQQTAQLRNNGLVVLASRRSDGMWLVALVRARSQPK